MHKIKALIMIVVISSICFSQHETEVSAETKLDGRSVKRSVLYVDCPHDGDSAYTDTGGVDLTADYYPQELMRGILLTAGEGNIGLILAGGGQMIFQQKVDSLYSIEAFRGWQIKKILADSITTFTGRLFPLW